MDSLLLAQIPSPPDTRSRSKEIVKGKLSHSATVSVVQIFSFPGRA